jgi:hypothetical protein
MKGHEVIKKTYTAKQISASEIVPEFVVCPYKH